MWMLSGSLCIVPLYYEQIYCRLLANDIRDALMTLISASHTERRSYVVHVCVLRSD